MKRRGFTIVELMIIIAVMGILLVLGVVNLNGAQASARDAERKTDIETIATQLETFYLSGTDGSTSTGSYPSTSVMNTKAAQQTTLRDIDPKSLIAPGSPDTSSTSLAVATTNSQTPSAVPFSGVIQALAVGGGGGGGGDVGGGGGGGGVTYNTAYGVTPQTYTVTVGSGGSSNYYGQNSSIVPSGSNTYGSSSANPGKSCYSLKLDGINYADGTYWIDPDGAGVNAPFQVYCDMTYNGGGWTMLMKATQPSSTFNYDANYWTTTNTLNSTDATRNNADAKFRSFNEMRLTDIMARWPDAGDMRWLRNSTWSNVTALTGFNTYANWGSPTGQPYWNATYFSTQTGIMQHGTKLGDLGGSGNGARWGSRYNNEADWNSDDVSNGIGLKIGYSAGDYVGCCAVGTGMNRTARVEVYGRNISDTADITTGVNAIGGGGGGWWDGGAGSPGGSGGGSSGSWNSPGSAGGIGISGQGYNGGHGWQGSLGGGSGGGAGGAGLTATDGNGRAGGVGIQNSISGTSTYYGGGGGAGGNGGTGVGGNGGGGTGPIRGDGTVPGGPGTANTGGGGGGTGGFAGGGAGGSGIVIISYPTGSITATGGNVTTNNGNTIHTFTSSGSFIVTSISSTSITSSSQNQYIYQPLNQDGSLCTTGSSCQKFNLYYITESDNLVHMVTSKNQ